MLRFDVMTTKAIGFLSRKVEHALRGRREWHLNGGGQFVAAPNALFDFRPQLCKRNIPVRKQSVHPFGIAQKSEQHMRGFDCRSAELAHFVSGKEKDSTRTFTVAVKHVSIAPTEAIVLRVVTVD